MDQRIPGIYVFESNIQGRGVFTTNSIAKDSLIEICPIIFLSEKDLELVKKTNLYNYYFEWGENSKSAAIILGFGSIYNHAYTPNAYYINDFESNTVSVYALRAIEVGEEITFNYNGTHDDQSDLWFLKNEA